MEDYTDVVILAGSVTVLLLLLGATKQRKPRDVWVHPYLAERNEKGRFATDFQDLTKSDKFFTENFHMGTATFETIFKKVEKHLKFKRNTRPYDRIPEKMRLAIVLEYLASGTISRHMSSIYRISKSSFTHIVGQVCDAIIYEFQNECMDFTNENWLSVANEYNYRWNLPNCLGAIYGKHVAIRCPPNSGSLFYNYKKFYSIVLMDISDASYKFIYVNVGAYGSEGDSGVFTSDKIGQKICNNTLPVPEDTNIDGKKIPFYFISDDAFPLQERIMKPYSPKRGQSLTAEERIFNYRLSRARRCVENSFGILSNKWLCLSQPLRQNPTRASKIVLACCVLHNLLIRKKSYCPPGFADYYDFNGDLVEGDWRSKTTQLTQLKTSVGRTCDKAKCVRDNLKYFVNSEVGTVPWQNKCLE